MGIILHGSRAIGMEREHSDWDMLLLFNEKPALASNREDIAGEDVEWKGFVLPIDKEDVLDLCGVVLQNARVLWEEQDEGSTLLRIAKEEYAKGAQLTNADRVRYRQFLVHKLHGMEDDKENPYLFFRHLSEFFTRSVNWWFELLHDENRKPFYLAFPEIEKRDPEYYQLLLVLCGESTRDQKLTAARTVIQKLFP